MKKTFLLTTALCTTGLAFAVMPGEAAVTKTTTVEYEFSAPGQEKNEVNSNTSTRRSCSSSSNGGSGVDTGGGFVDSDGDGVTDTHIRDMPNGFSGASTQMVGGNVNTTNSTSTIDDTGNYGGTHINGQSGTSINDDDDGGSSSSSSSSGGGGGGGGGGDCFITTAVTRATLEPDNGPTLTAMRDLRDHYARYTQHGDRRIALYYTLAPMIVTEMSKRPRAHHNWHAVHATHIRPIKALIDQGDYKAADGEYEHMVRTLAAETMSALDKSQIALLALVVSRLWNLPLPVNDSDYSRFILANIR